MTTIRKGSSKVLYIETPPTDAKMGTGQFGWTGDWSIFDYKEFGEMGWQVPYQDIALPVILQKTYEILHSKGVATCVTGVEDGRFRAHLVRRPGYELPLDPRETPVGTNNRMVDLEVTFNFVLHPKSSLYGRLQRGREDFRQYGFAQMPQLWDAIPLVEQGRVKFRYTTKFAKGGDVALDTEEDAKERSRLTDAQWLKGQENSTNAGLATYEYGKEVGLIVGDGKHEWMVDDKGNVLNADLIGNNYDDRFVVKVSRPNLVWEQIGVHATRYISMLNLPQEILSELRLRWVRQVEAHRGFYQDVGKQFQRNLYEGNGWRDIFYQERADGTVKTLPPLAIEPVQQATGDMYLAVAQVWNRDADVKKLAGREVRSLEDVAAELWVIEELNRMKLLPWEWKETT